MSKRLLRSGFGRSFASSVSALVLGAGALAWTSTAFAGQPDWSGLYAGLHGGYAWGTVSVLDNAKDGVPPGPFGYSASGLFGGATAGVNWQSGPLVAGVEGDLGYLNLSGSSIIGSSHADHHQDITLGGGLYGDLTGRLGLATGNTLFYGKGGAAFYSGQALQATTASGYSPTGTGVFTGWTLGGGIEQKITPKVSLKVEYLHFDFGTQAGYQTSLVDDPPTPAGTRFYNWTTVKADSIKVGLNWKFGG